MNLVAIAIAQEACLGFGFDAFGDNGEGEILAHGDGGFHQLLILRAMLRVADHAAVDVDGIEAEAIECGQGGVTGAEIVDGDANAQHANLPENLDGLAHIRQQRALGHAQFEQPRIDPRDTHDPPQVMREIRIRKLPCREVDAHGQWLARRLLNGHAFATCGFDDPFADRDDEPAFLGDRKKLPWQDFAQLGVSPAQQGFHAGDLAGGQIMLVLVVQAEFPMLQRLTQGDFQTHALQAQLAVGLLVKVEFVATFFLGVIHGDVGRLEQRLLVFGILGITADAHTDGHAEFLAEQVIGLADGRQDAIGHDCQVALITLFRQQNHEFVTGQTGDDIALAHRFLQPSSDLLQQGVAGVMPQGVVDQLEVIQVQEQDRQWAVITLGQRQELGQHVAEERTIGQPGQDIVLRHVLNTLGVGDLFACGALTALLELPAEIAKQGQKRNQGNAGDAAARDIGPGLCGCRAQLLGFGEASHDHQRKLVQLSGRRKALDAVPGVDHRRNRRQFKLVVPDQRMVIGRSASRDRFAAARGAKDSVGTQQADESGLAKLGRIVAADEIGCGDRDRDDSLKAVVRAGKAPGERQSGIITAGLGCGRTDDEDVLGPQQVDGGGVRNAVRRRGGGACLDAAIGIGDVDREQKRRQQQILGRQSGQHGLGLARPVGIDHQLQGAVDFPHGADDLRFVGIGQFTGAERGRGIGIGVLHACQADRCHPERPEQQDGQAGKEDQRFGDPAQQVAQAGGRCERIRRRRFCIVRFHWISSTLTRGSTDFRSM